MRFHPGYPFLTRLALAGLALLALVGPVLLAGSVLAEPLAWDQQKVTETAVDLDHAIDALLADPELSSQQATAMQQREHTAAVASSRRLRSCIDTLRRKLAAGYSRDDSFPFWEQCSELRGDVQAYARHSWLPKSTAERAERAGSLLDTLARYYEPAE